MSNDLPAEVWTQIFTLAADEDLIFQYALPTNLADSSWFRHVTSNWALRTPQEAANLLMRRSYRTKKAIMLTCKRWHEIAFELLFRCLFFNNPTKLFELCKILESSSASATTITSSHGWWTRRLHVCRYSTRECEEHGITNEDMQTAFVLIISHCPNLEIFHVDWPMKQAFGPVADALATFSKRSLRTIQWNVPSNALSKVIWALDSLKYIVAAHIEFEASAPSGEEEDECVNLGSAFELQLKLRHLHQLSIRGYSQAFLEQASGWMIPSLKSFSLDNGISKGDAPDVVGFLTHHGHDLEYLDLDTTPALNIADILDLCPQVSTFAFNADRKVIPSDEAETEIVHRPTPNITTIGVHGLSYAFGVGLTAMTANPTHTRIIQRFNDMNMAALNRRNFPNLKRVRALGRGMLMDLNKAGQPSHELGGMERWTRWWDRFAQARIRLEDCTGDFLGNLPDFDAPSMVLNDGEDTVDESDSDEYDDDDDDDDSDDDDNDDSDDDAPSGWKVAIPPMPDDSPSERTTELRQLLEECRLMAREREESMFAPMFPMGMMGGGGFPPNFGGPFPGANIATGSNVHLGFYNMNTAR